MTRKTWGFRSPLGPQVVPGEHLPWRESVSAFLFSYTWQKYLETAPFSLWSCHTANLTGQFFLPSVPFACTVQTQPYYLPLGVVIVSQVGDVSLWQMYLTCLFKYALCLWSDLLRSQGWLLCFCSGDSSVFFHHVPISNLVKADTEMRFPLFSLLRPALQTYNAIALDCIDLKIKRENDDEY